MFADLLIADLLHTAPAGVCPACLAAGDRHELMCPIWTAELLTEPQPVPAR